MTKILVYGANGSQTGAGTQVLMEHGHDIRVLMRSEEKGKAWADRGAEIALGQMSDLDSLTRASEGVEAIFLLIPTFRDSDEAGVAYGVNAIKAAKAAGVSKVIWNTSGPVANENSPEAETDPGARVVRQLKEEGISFLGLQPTLYMENFLGPWTREQLKADSVFSYPIPPNFKAHWIASQDFGLVANAALQGELPNEIIQLGGPMALGGEEITDIFSRGLDRDLAFETMPVDIFQNYITQAAGPRIGGIIGGLYGAIQDAPDQLEPAFAVNAVSLAQRFNVELTTLERWISNHRELFE